MKAGGFKRQLEQFDTFFGLKLSYLLFAPTEQLSRTLQAKNITVQEAHSAAQATHSYVQGKRSDKAFQEWYGKVLSASEANTDPPVLPRKRRMPRRLDDGHAPHQPDLAEDMYRAKYFEAVDVLCGELNRRFDQRDRRIAGDIEKILLDLANG